MTAIVLTTPRELESIINASIENAIESISEKISNEMMSKSQPLWLTRFQMAKKENCSVSLVDKLRRQGRYEVKKLGRKTLLKIKE